MKITALTLLALVLGLLPSNLEYAQAQQYWDCEIFVEGVGTFSGYGLSEDEAYDHALDNCYNAGLPTHPNICFNSKFRCY